MQDKGIEGVFIVTKFYTAFLDQRRPVYAIWHSPLSYDKTITKEAAYDIIEQYGMEASFRSEDGKIWELPGKPFYKKYKGFFAAKRKKQGISAEVINFERRKLSAKEKRRLEWEKLTLEYQKKQ